MKKPFFTSQKHPGLYMNRHGVVLADKEHPLAATDLWAMSDWNMVPLKNGNLDTKYEIWDEAREQGYTRRSVGFLDEIWSKPKAKTNDKTNASSTV